MSMLAEIRCLLVLAVPNQNHRRTEAQIHIMNNPLLPGRLSQVQALEPVSINIVLWSATPSTTLSFLIWFGLFVNTNREYC